MLNDQGFESVSLDMGNRLFSSVFTPAVEFMKFHVQQVPLLPGVNWLEHVAGRSSLSGSEVVNVQNSYVSSSPYT